MTLFFDKQFFALAGLNLGGQEVISHISLARNGCPLKD